MGVDAMEVGIYVKKGLIFTIGNCYRSACNHPFLVGFGCFLFLLYVYLPALFAFFLSSSPVIVCTAALLGTLLSFGNPNIPEIEEDEKEEEEKMERITQHEISSLKTGFLQGDLVVEKAQRFSPETCMPKTRDVNEEAEDEKALAFSTKTHEDVSTTSSRSVVIGEIHEPKQVIEEESQLQNQGFTETREIGGGKQVIKEEGELQNQGFREMRELQEKEPLMEEGLLARRFSDNDDQKETKVQHVESDKLAGELPGTHSEDPFGSIQDFSPWKEMEDHDDESLDSGSDGAESSSPDASMADIIPMLEELHPLLETGPPQPAFIPLNDSDAASERSHGSNEGSREDGENQEEEDDDDDDEEEEAQQGAQDGEIKPVVTWTEDDERNLMDLGNSELERNRRLESLIARRRARKNFRTMLVEKNLIDFDASDPPFPIAPISTARHNPFDIHYDSNETMGLPPIPGSAPSVLLPRRNPFDLPYDPLEERPNLTGGSFEEEFITAYEKDAFFRRHESFSLGSSSFFGEFKQEKQHSKFRPYFVTEQSEREGFHTFQRQWSGRSDSKVSSVTETESLSSVAEQDDHKSLYDRELSQEGKPMPPAEHLERVCYPTLPSQLSEISDSKVSSVAESESLFSIAEQDDHKSSNGQELSQEGKPLPPVEHAPDNVPLQSSSTELNLVDIYLEDKRDADIISNENKRADGEDAYERESNLLDRGLKPTQDYMEAEVTEKQHMRSSSSSSSEETEKIFHANMDEVNEDPTNDANDENSNSSMQSSVMDSDHTDRVVGLDDNQTKEPVYDWSPSAMEKSLSGITIIQEALCVDKEVRTSSSFVESDKHVDTVESYAALRSEERTISPADGEFSLHQDNIADDTTSGLEGSWTASSHMSAVEENEMMSREVTVISEHDVIKVGFSGDNQNSDDLSAQMVPSIVEQVLSDTDSSSTETESEDEEAVNEEAKPLFQQVEAPSLSLEQEMNIRAPQFDTDEADVKASADSGDSSGFLISTASEKLPPLLEESTVPSSSDGDHKESKEPLSQQEMSIKEANVISKFDEAVVYDHEHKDSSDLSPSVSGPSSFPQFLVPQADFEDVLHDATQSKTNSPVAKHLDVPQETISSQISEKEVNVFDGIKEIDEGLLTELDAVSDFHVEEQETNRNHIENNSAVGAQERLNGQQGIEADSTEDRVEYVADNLIKPQVGAEQEVPLETGAQSLNAIVEDQYPSASGSNTSELHVVEASSIEDIDSVFEQLSQRVEESSILHHDQLPKEMEVTDAIVEPPNEGPTQMQTVEKLPDLEARCLEDADSTSKQEHEGEPKKPIVPELNEGPVQEDSEAGFSEFEVPNQNSNEIDEILEMPVLEARSLEDIDSVFKKLHKGEIESVPIRDALISDKIETGSADIEHANQDQDLIEMEPSAIEEKSVEDKDSESEQLEDRVIEMPVTLEPIHDASMVQESVVQSVEPRSAERGPASVDSDSELRVVEARSIEDIDSAFNHLQEGGDHDKHNHPENMDSIGFDSELRVVEARTVGDIDAAFNQLHEQGDHEKHSTHSENVENKPQLLESRDSTEITSHLQEVDVRSVEEVGLVPKEVSTEGKMEGTQKKVNSEVGSSETSSTKDLESATENKSDFEESVVNQETKVGCEESKPVSVEMSESSSSRKKGLRKKKKGSSKSGSSSSSSSSSSDSD